MSTFSTIHKPTDGFLDPRSNDNIVDWYEFRGSQGLCNFVWEMHQKWPDNYFVHSLYDTARGGGSGATLGCLWEEAHADSGPDAFTVTYEDGVPQYRPKPVSDRPFIKEPRPYKPAFKGLVLLCAFQKSPFAKFAKSDKQFKKWTGVNLDSPEGKRLLQPIPIIALQSRQHFGCKRNRQTKEEAIEKVIRLMGPGETWNLSEARSRVFGYGIEDPYGNGTFRGERLFWTVYVLERDENEVLTVEKKDFWQLLQEFYSTSDMTKMKKQNPWAKLQAK